MPELPESRKQAADGNGVTLREFIDSEFRHQTTLLDERARHHDSEHQIHITAHESEHSSTQIAIKVATDALDKRLDSMDKEVNLKLDVLTKAIEVITIERASLRGYIVGLGAVLGFLVVVANFVAGFIRL